MACDLDPDFIARVAAVRTTLDSWRGCRAAAASYLGVDGPTISRYVNHDVMMSGERLVILERFCQLSVAEQKTYLSTN